LILTLAINAIAQGLMVVHTSGFAPQEHATPAMRFIAVERSIAGIPNAVWMWAGDRRMYRGLLRRTTFGRRVYGIGNSERAVFLSRETSIASWSPVLPSPELARVCRRAPGGYSTKAYQAMAIRISCRRSRRSCSGARAFSAAAEPISGPSPAWVLMTLLQSILSIVQVPEAARQVIYGAVIILMLSSYGRGQKVAS